MGCPYEWVNPVVGQYNVIKDITYSDLDSIGPMLAML